MPVITYQTKNMRAATLATIEQANEIIAEYRADGFDLTLRQLYYQFVSRDLFANNTAQYNRLGSIISDARLCGLVDWSAITDRTRRHNSYDNWTDPAAIIEDAARWYQRAKWADQPVRCEVWIEKDALIGVLEHACAPLDVDYFSCRGYVSQSSMWQAGQRIMDHERESGQTTVLFHLGDHDPSGIDMTRDIRARLTMFCEQDDFTPPDVRRIALNMDQVESHEADHGRPLPPNPAKQTDVRFEAYEREFGDQSWELDALSPSTLTALIEQHVGAERDDDLWNAAVTREASEREQIRAVAASWESCVEVATEDDDEVSDGE